MLLDLSMLTGHVALSRIPGCPCSSQELSKYRQVFRATMQEPSKYMQVFCITSGDHWNICRSFAQPCKNHQNIWLCRFLAQPCRNHQNICRSFVRPCRTITIYADLLCNHAGTIKIYALCRSFAQPCRNYLNVVKQFRNKSETTKDAAGLLLRKKVQQVASTCHRPFFHRKVIGSSVQVPLSLWITS